MRERIGFIGLGIMGKPMAINLLQAGYKLSVLDTNPEAVNEVCEAGAGAATSPREVAANSDVVITVLPDSPQVLEVVLGVEGILDGAQEGMLYVDMSSVASATSTEIYNKLGALGIQAVDAPMSGGQPGAEQGTLSIMVGGDDSAVQRAMPILDVLGGRISHIGGPGAGQITKSCNQICVANITQGVIEALTLARKAGVDPVRVREAMLGGFAQCKALDVHGQKILDRDFQPGFKVELYRKDLRIALQTARELAVPLMGASIVAGEMDALIAQGEGELDFSALVKVVERLGGIDA